MKAQISSWFARCLAPVRLAAANIDPEILQWPAGSLIATVLCLYTTVCSNCRQVVTETGVVYDPPNP